VHFVGFYCIITNNVTHGVMLSVLALDVLAVNVKRHYL